MRTNWESASRSGCSQGLASMRQPRLNLEGAKHAGSDCEPSVLIPLLRSVSSASRNCVPQPIPKSLPHQQPLPKSLPGSQF